MQQPTIHFVAGLPRSGSTLLMNLLGQNPRHHVTPTNALVDMAMVLRDGWSTNPAFMGQGLDVVQPRVTASIRGMMYGFYERELAAGQVVFDKSRGWIAALEVLEHVFRRPVPVIVTVRDLRAVLASFEKLYRRNPMYRHPFMGDAFYAAQTIEGRARVLLGPQSVVGIAVNRLRDAMNRGVSDRLVVVPYATLTASPRETMAYLHERLGLPAFEYDPDHVEQITVEDDMIHGWGPDLHTIRSRVEPAASAPWADVLPPHVCAWVEQEYADINRLAAWSPLEAEQGAEAR